jgi:hypothetical protein
MRQRGIAQKRTLAASPFQNSLVERSNGRVKGWLFKRVRTKGGSWVDHLQHMRDVANSSMNRSTGNTPKEALALDKAGRATLRGRVLRAQEEGGRPPRKDYPLGLAVRYKLAKSALAKSTTPSWSQRIYKVTGVYPGRSPMEATRYRIDKPRSADLRYGPHDLKAVIEGPPEPIPGDGGTDDEEDDDGGEGPDAAAVAQAQADKKAKADANKKKQTDADSAVVAKYMGKTVKAPAGEGGDGKVVAVVRRKAKGVDDNSEFK